MKKVLAFSGSNSSSSVNQKLVTQAASYISNAETEVIDIRDYPAPIYSMDEEQNNGFPEGMKNLLTKFREADGIIFSSPEHNSMVPTVFKNIIDWMSRMERSFFDGKAFLLMTASPGPGGGRFSMEYLKNMVPRWGANLVDVYSIGGFFGSLEGEHETAVKEKVAQLEEAL